MSSKGQIVLPAELREQDQIATGQSFEIVRLQAGEYLIRKAVDPGKPGLVKWLRNCPQADWFVPIVSETTPALIAWSTSGKSVLHNAAGQHRPDCEDPSRKHC
jgi:AbrB family looped-hinge helix DNA binding protein